MATAALARTSPAHAQIARWRALATQLRVDSIRCTTAAGSGHPTSAMSAAELIAVLIDGHLRYDVSTPHRPDNDRLIFSKGHAAPLLYAALHAMSAISDQELLSLRRFGSLLEGHPTPRLPFVDAATGSLGQGLPLAVGIALAGRHLEHNDLSVWVLLGDSEMAEGSNYEALEAATYYGLGNITAIVDVNRLGQRGQTELGWDIDAYRKRFVGFGWNALMVDGHDPVAIDSAYCAARESTLPTAIIARTVKGQGVSFTANADKWHGRAMTGAEEAEALGELHCGERLTVNVRLPTKPTHKQFPLQSTPLILPRYSKDRAVSTRQAFGDALKALGDARKDVVVLDAEVANSTFTQTFQQHHPDRFFEMFIAEQLLINAGQGISVPRRHVVFCATFAAFLTRAHDQIRMAAISHADLRLCGSHCGISIGEDGPSQMGLEDISLMRSICGSTVLYPCDAVSTAHLVAIMADRPGISYLRATRSATPVLYGQDDSFPIGGSKTLRSSAKDRATLIGAGITLHEALKAADHLATLGISVRVIDLYSIKPIDIQTLEQAAEETPHLVICEDHWAEGGIGDAVMAAIVSDGGVLPCISHLAIREMPRSGKPEELMEHYGISAAKIISAVLEHLDEHGQTGQ